MQLERFTLKAQEALAAAQKLAQERGHAQIEPEHLAARPSRPGGRPDRAHPGAHRRQPRRRPGGAGRSGCDYFSTVHGATQMGLARETAGSAGGGPVRGRQDEGRLRLHRARAHGAGGEQGLAGRPAQALRRHPRRHPPGAQGPARLAAGRGPQRRGEVPGAGALRPRPHRPGPPRQARPGHRPRRRDPPGDPGAQPPDQEQPGAHRRAGRGQDGHRRGAGAAHRVGRRARGPQEQAGRRPGHRGAWWPAPSTAASSRSA